MKARFFIAALALALFAPEAASQTPPDTNAPPRGVVILDTSYSMSRCKRAATNLVATLLATGLNGRLASGDRVAFWTFDERVRKTFPVQDWSTERRAELAPGAIQHLRGQRFIKRTDSAALARELVALRQSVADGVVALITDGEADVGGTAFDRQINAALRQNRRSMRAKRLPFVILLSLRSGQFSEWAVHSGEAPQVVAARAPTEAPQKLAVSPNPTAPRVQTQPPTELPQPAKTEAPIIVPSPAKPAVENPPVPEPAAIAEKPAAQPAPATAGAEKANSPPATAPAPNAAPDTAQPKANPVAVENTQPIPGPSQPALPVIAPSSIPSVQPEKLRDEPAAVPSISNAKPNATPAAEAIVPPVDGDTARVPNVAASPTEPDASTPAANNRLPQSPVSAVVSALSNNATSTIGNGIAVSPTALATPATHARKPVALWITGAACLVLAVAAFVLYGRLSRPRRSSLISQSLDRERQ